MSDYIEISARTVDDAITEALIRLGTTSDKIEYEIIDKGSTGVLGFIGKKPAIIKAKKKFNLVDYTYDFLNDMFKAMGLDVKSEINYDEDEKNMDIMFSGDTMGVLIGKHGQTLDSLQYIVSLVVNKESESYVKVKVDTENYRERRKETLETLAKNIAYKVKRTRRPVALEPMNPYERRIIHSALQNDKYVETHSEGDEPYRKVVVTMKKYKKDRGERRDRSEREDRRERTEGAERKERTDNNAERKDRSERGEYKKNGLIKSADD